MSLKQRFLLSTLPFWMFAHAAPAFSQNACAVVDGDGNVTGGLSTSITTQIQSSTENDGGACDVLVNADGEVSAATGSAIVINSDNTANILGTVSTTDADNTTAIELQGGNSGSLTLTGSLNLTESVDAADDDGDGTPDGPFAQGAGRTGILISGASPFVGNVTTEGLSTIAIEGNDSYAFRIVESAGLAGDINLGGTIGIVGGIPRDAAGAATGGPSRAVLIEGDVDGDLNHTGTIDVRGEGASGIVLAGDLTGGLTNDGTITNSGFRFTNSQTVLGNPDVFDDTDNLQAGAAILVNGNVGEGVHLRNTLVTSLDENDEEVVNQVGNSQVLQFGSAPAILFDGQGSNIIIGQIVPLTNTDSPELQFAFVNQGSVSASGVFADFTATALEVRDATLIGGINNVGSILAGTTRGSGEAAADAALARVVVLGSGAIVDTINNSGVLQAIVTENQAEIFADLDNPLAPQSLNAVAIDVEANASISSIVNSGTIQATLIGRNGTAVALRDASGSITVIENTGNIIALGTNSDPLGEAAIEFTTIALDLSANTSGVTLNQSLANVDTPNNPNIIGDVFLGTGDDAVNLAAGTLVGDLDFSDGADSLTISGGASYIGTLTDTGDLVIDVLDGGSLLQTSATPITATSASFDATSTYSPTIDGQNAAVSTLVTTGDITFAEGATITPVLSSVVDAVDNTFTILDAGGTLSLGGDLDSLVSFTSPFLYDSTFQIDPNDPNALLITLDLRSTEALGLDPVQAGSFDTTFDALLANPELAQAFVNITDGDQFGNAVNQLLPEFAAAARHFVVANVDGAVGAVGTHLDNARQSDEQPGGAWIQQFTYFADRDLAGFSEQFRGFGFGFTGGFDTQVGPFHTLGVNFGFASSEIEDVVGVDDPLDILTYQTGVYAGLKSGDFSLDLYGGGGYSNFDQTRNVLIGGFSDSSDASWSGTHLNGSVRGGVDFDLSKKIWLRPAFSIDYLRLNENGYTETGLPGSAITLDVDGRTSELAGATALLNIGGNFNGERTWIRPALRFGYRNEFINDGVTTSFGFAERELRSTVTSEAFPSDGFLLGFSVAAGTGYSSFGFDFDSDIRDGFIRHTGRVVLRMIF